MSSLKLKPCLALLLSLGGAVATSHADPTVYSQPASDASTTGYYTWAAYTGPSDGVFAQTYDNFTLDASSNVTAIQWYGNYIDFYTPSNNPGSPDTTSFEIIFYSDDAGQPGTVLATETVSMADSNPTSHGTLEFQGDTGLAASQVPFYSYSAVLPTPFAAAAGQQYWISILGNCTAAEPGWYWYSGNPGTGGDGQSIQDFEGEQIRQLDRAFTLEGTPNSLPPLPSTFFTGEVSVGNGVYYLAFLNGNYFGYYSFLSDPHYIYHFDLGYEYVFDAGDGNDGVYLYDFKSNDFFYSSPTFPFPYLYDFNLNTVLYYYPSPTQAGHYNTDGVRYFYDFATQSIITK